MAISPIIVPSEDREKRDTLDRIAQVIGIASNALEAGIAIPKYLQERKFASQEAQRREEAFPLEQDVRRTQINEAAAAKAPLTPEQIQGLDELEVPKILRPQTQGEFETWKSNQQISPVERMKIEQKDEEIRLKKDALEQKKAEKEERGTSLERKIDERFADDFIEWETAGQKEQAQTNITKLDRAIEFLNTEEGLTGKKYAFIPEDALPVTHPKAAATRELVRGVVQLSLRPILGAQFAEKEGERVMNNTYNIKLSQDQVKQRVKDLRDQLRRAFEQKQDAIRYYRENKTLRGWGGNLAGKGDIMPDEKYGEQVGDAGVF